MKTSAWVVILFAFAMLGAGLNDSVEWFAVSFTGFAFASGWLYRRYKGEPNG